VRQKLSKVGETRKEGKMRSPKRSGGRKNGTVYFQLEGLQRGRKVGKKNYSKTVTILGR